jgi:YHS domain-containing protein
MASLLLRFFVIIFALWYFRRLLAKIFGSSRPKKMDRSAEGASSNMVKDPVCGMYMDSRLAIRIEKRAETLYFCSEDCKKRYIGKGSGDTGVQSPPSA